jgi:hypothetical protein
LTSLEASEEEIAAASGLKMDPPEIIYREHPALLIMIDGDPVTICWCSATRRRTSSCRSPNRRR